MQEQLKSLKEAAALAGLSRQRLQQLAVQGRVVGARRVGSYWVIPTPVSILPPASRRGPRKC